VTGIPDEAVDAAAAVIYADERGADDPPWAEATAANVDAYRSFAYNIVAAAWPLLAAQALREAAAEVRTAANSARAEVRTAATEAAAAAVHTRWNAIATWLDRRADEIERQGDLVCGQHGNPWPCTPCIEYSAAGNAVGFYPRSAVERQGGADGACTCPHDGRDPDCVAARCQGGGDG